MKFYLSSVRRALRARLRGEILPNKAKVPKKLTAFTLIELLVSLTIISIIAALSISSYPKFSQQLEVTTETYKMLAYFRETQSYGVSAVATPGIKFVYGFVIDKNENSITKIIKESPTDQTNAYFINNLAADTNATTSKLKDGFEIFKICGKTGSADCENSLDKGYAFFRRPLPEARLTGKLGEVISPDVNKTTYDSLEVTVRSKKNPQFMKKIVILHTGQMYVSDW